MSTTAALLARLRAVRNVYGAVAARELCALLDAVRDARCTTFAQLSSLHEDLLFISAFPASPGARTRARRLLRGVGARLARLPRHERARADDSGMAGSTTRHLYPFPIAQWLAQSAAGAEIDWRHVDDPTRLDGAVRTLLCPAEREAFDSGEYATRDWIARARRSDAASDLAWLAQTAAATPAARTTVADAWDAAEIPVAWPLSDSRWSVTHNLLPRTHPVCRNAMRRPDTNVAAEVARPLDAIERLTGARARAVVAAARAALAARCREVNAMTCPNLDEVWWCDLAEGVALAVIGIAPDERLSLETNTGYLLFANGVPIGYGGVTPLFRQANTGINIFDAFRGGEAAFLWTQMLRAFHSLYGSRRFVINAYQFGADNAEAIASGAFWFYYRLGFRPAAAATRTLAAQEAARMAADRKYRSNARTLKALAVGDLHLDLPGFDAADHFDEALLPRAGALAAHVVAQRPERSRLRAATNIATELAATLDLADHARWSPRERRGFAFLAPIVAALPDLRDWNTADRAALAAMLRAKGAPQERGYALKAQRAPRFFASLRTVLRSPAAR